MCVIGIFIHNFLDRSEVTQGLPLHSSMQNCERRQQQSVWTLQVRINIGYLRAHALTCVRKKLSQKLRGTPPGGGKIN